MRVDNLSYNTAVSQEDGMENALSPYILALHLALCLIS
jgi:hypothetical protein